MKNGRSGVVIYLSYLGLSCEANRRSDDGGGRLNLLPIHEPSIMVMITLRSMPGVDSAVDSALSDLQTGQKMAI